MKCLFSPLWRFATASFLLLFVIGCFVLPIVSADDLSWNQEESTSESSACNNKFQLVGDFVLTDPFYCCVSGRWSDFVTKGTFFFFFGGNLQVLNSNLDGDFLIVFLVVKSDSMLYVYANYLVDINLTLSLTTCQIISMESSWLNMAIYCSYHPLLVH